MKKIELKIEVNRDKSVSIRLSLLRIDEENPDDEIETFHRIMLVPGSDIVAVRAANEAHLSMPYIKSGIKGAPWPKIPDEEWAEVEAVASLIHTKERIDKRIAFDAEVKRRLPTAKGPI